MSGAGVLAALDSAAVTIGNLPELPGYNGSILQIDDTEAERIDRELTEARDAVRELIDAAARVASKRHRFQAIDSPDGGESCGRCNQNWRDTKWHFAGNESADSDLEDLRGALARVQGGES